ncbi:MAG: EAL domain-containing protein, partial [Actinomycetota bacterium]|nr:EAL domain-containing protein [Actinomycetota bacterium]
LRGTGGAQEGIRLAFLEREFEINAGRTQILDLLVSTFEELVVTSREVRTREAELMGAHASLQRHLHAAELERKRLRAVVDSVPVPLFVLLADGVVSHASEASARTFGTTTEEMHGRELEAIVTFTDADGSAIQQSALPHRQALAHGRPASIGAAFDVFLKGPRGVRLPVLFEASPILDERGAPVSCVATVHVLGALTQYDALTGLPNAVAYLERVAQVFAAPREDAALMLLELDRFDAVHAVRGTVTGNQAVVQVARRLAEVFAGPKGTASRSQCFLAHLGRNRFGVVIADLPDSFNVLHLAEAARRAASTDSPNPGTLRVTASVGVALGDLEQDASQLYAAAVAALGQARHAGGDRVAMFGHEDSRKAMERLELEIALRAAVDHAEIAVQYQPETRLASGHLVGFEALARWSHEGRPIGPDVFVALAEESGTILALGRHVLRLACSEASRWPEMPGDGPLAVAVNVSALQLRPSFVGEVLEALDESGLDPTRLVLEVTESATMADPAASLPLLEELRSHGVRIALDDFGTGHSSLALLTQIQFDQLKLDRSFVAGIQDGGREALVAQSVITLGHSLGVPVLAEGIETPLQLDLLRDLGCTQGQGYLLSRPMDAASVPAVLEEARRRGGVLAVP